MGNILEIVGASAGYGHGDVIRDLSLSLGEGELLGLLGANGAGKTTLSCMIAGHRPLTSGRIVFGGIDVTRTSPDRLARMGIAHVPQGRRVFPDLTVNENLGVAKFAAGRRTSQDTLDFVYELFPKLIELGGRKGGVLSGGEQQMLSVARAILCEPSLIIFDEPSLGLAPVIVHEMYEALSRISERGVTILLAEQAVGAVMAVADRIAVIEAGALLKVDTPDAFVDDAFIVSSYLGGGVASTESTGAPAVGGEREAEPLGDSD